MSSSKTENKRKHFPTDPVSSILPCYQNRAMISQERKKKLETYITYLCRYKNLQQNISVLYPVTYKMLYTVTMWDLSQKRKAASTYTN